MNNQDEGKSSLAERLMRKKQSVNPLPEAPVIRRAEVDEEKIAPSSSEEESKKIIKKSAKKEAKEKFYTYMSPENYEEFEEMFISVRKAVSKKTRKKIKVTNMAELAIILAKKQLFDKDKKNFLALVEEELERE